VNVLSIGRLFSTYRKADLALLDGWREHEVRTLEVEEDADYGFAPHETAEQVIARISKAWPPDILLCWYPEMYPPPRRVEECPIPTAALVSDWNLHYPQLCHNLARYDYILTDRLGERELRVEGVAPRFVTPLYSQKSHIHRKMDVEKDIDVLFVGNLNFAIHVERGRLLERLSALAGRYTIVICGGHFDEAYARMLSRARIVFNHSVRREMNLRCFETLACGALLFVEEDNLEVRDFLTDREEMVLYRPDNLLELVEYYLEHPEAREQITRQGHRKACALAGETRFPALLAGLSEAASSGRPFTRFPRATQDLAEILQYVCLVPSQTALAAELASRGLERYPEQPEFMLATIMARLADAEQRSPGDAGRFFSDLLRLNRQVCALRSDAAVPWLNLAAILRVTGREDAERKTLELAMQATSSDYATLLLGKYSDPYFVAWGRDSAMGQARIGLLQAMAASRLAEIHLEQSRPREARQWAANAIKFFPGVARPYAALATAEARLGNAQKAVETLAETLPLAPFDSQLRVELIGYLRNLGEEAKARALAEESARIVSMCPDAADNACIFRRLAANETLD